MEVGCDSRRPEGQVIIVASSLDHKASPRLQHMGLAHFVLPAIALLVVSFAIRKCA